MGLPAGAAGNHWPIWRGERVQSLLDSPLSSQDRYEIMRATMHITRGLPEAHAVLCYADLVLPKGTHKRICMLRPCLENSLRS